MNQALYLVHSKQKASVFDSNIVNHVHRLITDHNHPTPTAGTIDGYIPCLRFEHSNNNRMEKNKRAYSLIEAKFRTNTLIIERVMLTKDIKTT